MANKHEEMLNSPSGKCKIKHNTIQASSNCNEKESISWKDKKHQVLAYFSQCLLKWNTDTSYDQHRCIPNRNMYMCSSDACTRMFPAALSVMPLHWKLSKHPSVIRWINCHGTDGYNATNMSE